MELILKNKIIQIECLCISLICITNIVNQDIMSVYLSYPHLRIPQTVKINILIVAEHYYCFIDGNVIRGKINELIAVEPLLRWVLTGYYDKISTTNNFNATHMLRVTSEIFEHLNDDYKTMKKVLNYDSDAKLSMENENDCIENFKKTLKFDRKRHVTKLPFIENPENLTDNYILTKKRTLKFGF